MGLPVVLLLIPAREVSLSGALTCAVKICLVCQGHAIEWSSFFDHIRLGSVTSLSDVTGIVHI